MALTLTLRGGDVRESRTLERGTLSIGRASGNDWVLPDPDHQLSRTHCLIAAADGRYVLTDVSTNGVFVNGAAERVARNGQVALNDGDEFRLGEYVVSVAEGVAAATTNLDPFAPGHVPLTPGGMRRADPLAGPGDATPDPLGGDPLDDPFGAAPAARLRPPDRSPAGAGAARRGPVRPARRGQARCPRRRGRRRPVQGHRRRPSNGRGRRRRTMPMRRCTPSPPPNRSRRSASTISTSTRCSARSRRASRKPRRPRLPRPPR